MNKKANLPGNERTAESGRLEKITSTGRFRVLISGVVPGLISIAGYYAWAQTSAVLKITPVGTNQYSVTITNAIGTNDYDLEWNSVLTDDSNTNFQWTYAAIGVPGGTNFLLDANPYQATFFRAILDNLSVPLWQAADPSNTNSPVILTVTILNPTNGAVLQ